MATKIKLISWGSNMTSATVTYWYKNVGDEVVKDEPVVEVEACKLNFTIVAPCTGVISNRYCQTGEDISVGDILALIVTTKEYQKPKGTETNQTRPTTPINYSGDSPNELSGLRRTIASRMMHSLRSMAQITLTTETDLTNLESLQRDLNSKYKNSRIRSLHLIVKAAAKALEEHHALNGTLANNQVKLSDNINIGVAVSIDRGLIVPVIHKANSKSIATIAEEILELSRKARDGNLGYDEVTGGTFTVSSLATYDIDAFTPIINPPEIAILGVGRTTKKPMVVDDAIVIRSMASFSITFDHQAIDGAPAASYLRTLKNSLLEPNWMAW